MISGFPLTSSNFGHELCGLPVMNDQSLSTPQLESTMNAFRCLLLIIWFPDKSVTCAFFPDNTSSKLQGQLGSPNLWYTAT